jgi:ankyrin repeat protein
MAASKLFYEFLSLACQSSEKAESLLLKHPGIIRIRCDIGETVLHYLAIENKVEAVEMLIRHGADVNNKTLNRETPLHHAAMLGYADMTRLLLNAGADANALTDSQETPLHSAASGSADPEVLSTLLAKGANPNAKCDLGDTALALILKNSRRKLNRDQAVEVLLKAGAGPNELDGFGQSPLELAIEKQALIKTIDLLIRSGANVNARNAYGESLLEVAQRLAYNEAVTRLRAAGATDQLTP